MSSDNEIIFTNANKLQSCEVSINDIALIQETIIHMEFCYKNDTPMIIGKLLFNDLYDMNLQTTWIDAIINVVYVDKFGDSTTKTYRALEINEIEHGIYRKAFELTLQDEFSYVLEHSYLSKGFSGTVSDALTSYLTQLEISDKVNLDITNTEIVQNFIVPKNENNLDFFINEFKKNGFTFYQKRDSICVHSLDDLLLANMNIESDPYISDTDNQFYMNRIITNQMVAIDREAVGPKIRSLSYNFENKLMNYDNTNDYSNYSLNNNDSSVLDDFSGYMDVCQQHSNFNEHVLNFKNSILQQNIMDMVTNGYYKNEVNQIYTLLLRGNVVTSDGQTKGNKVVGGKYNCNKVVDKIIGDSFIQKISLQRSDAVSK